LKTLHTTSSPLTHTHTLSLSSLHSQTSGASCLCIGRNQEIRSQKWKGKSPNAPVWWLNLFLVLVVSGTLSVGIDWRILPTVSPEATVVWPLLPPQIKLLVGREITVRLDIFEKRLLEKNKVYVVVQGRTRNIGR